jgi:hypothetical protein
LEWIANFKGAYPQLKDRSREIYLTLTGHADWPAMEMSCDPNATLFDFETLSPEDRRQISSRMRKILVEVFRMRPTVANHIAWINPPGSRHIWPLHTLESSVLLTDGTNLDYERVYAELDDLNMGFCTGTEQGQRRLNQRPGIGAHLGLCKQLGWELEILGPTDQQITEMGGEGRFVAEPFAFVKDAELGRVPIFVAGFTSTPGQAHDEVLVEYLAAALNTAELINGASAPGIVFFESSVSRKIDDHYYTSFGSMVINDTWKDLFLNEACHSVSDVLVRLMTTGVQDMAMIDVADNGLRLQKMFEKARQKHQLPVGSTGTFFGTERPSGWCTLELHPNL